MANSSQTVKYEELDNRKLILALSGIILSILLASLDQTIVNPALPRVVEELKGFTLYSWVATAYLLTSTATILIAGKLGDMFGRKWLLLGSVALFLLGSALSGAAPSMIWLVIFRGLQGIGAGGLQSNAFAVIGELFPDSAKRARWQGLIAAAFGVSSVIGPTLGGFITDNFNWRWIFYVNVPIGGLAMVVLFLTLPQRDPSGRRRIDWTGAAIMVAAVVCLLLALTWGGHVEPLGYPWLSVQVIGLLVASVVLGGLFIWVETKVDEPILPLRLFNLPALRSILVVSFALGAVMLGATYYIPLFVQVVQGQSASSSGAVSTPLSLALVFANIMTGQFIGRVGFLKYPLLSGGVFTVLGIFLLTTLTTSSELWQVTIYMIVLGFGLGQIMPTMTITVQETVARKDLGVGTSAVQFFRSIGSTVGVALIGSIVSSNYASSINAAPVSRTLSPQLLELISEPQNLTRPGVATSLAPNLVAIVRDSLSAAIHNGFLISLGVGVLALLAALTVPNIRVKTGQKKPTEATNVAVTEGSVPQNVLETGTELRPQSLGAADSGASVETMVEAKPTNQPHKS